MLGCFKNTLIIYRQPPSSVRQPPPGCPACPFGTSFPPRLHDKWTSVFPFHGKMIMFLQNLCNRLSASSPVNSAHTVGKTDDLYLSLWEGQCRILVATCVFFSYSQKKNFRNFQSRTKDVHRRMSPRIHKQKKAMGENSAHGYIKNNLLLYIFIIFSYTFTTLCKPVAPSSPMAP